MLCRMDTGQYIRDRQLGWAFRRGIKLEGGKGARGERRYCVSLEDNLFVPLSPASRAEFERGDGGELGGKMRALHSSAAACVNLFEYWRRNQQVHVIAKACGLPASGTPELCYEENKLPVGAGLNRAVFKRNPNIDAVLRYGPGSRARTAGIEFKFTEAYGSRGYHELSERYLTGDWWDGLTNLRQIAGEISPTDTTYHHLHPAQLIKHVLVLRHAHGPQGFRLLYLWYDGPFDDGCRHREEVSRFAEAAKRDGVAFQAITMQEVIHRLACNHREAHAKYVDYLTERYL
jgi:hypothetical protein